jgi:lipopolysaccharide transport system permease protein
MLGSTWAVINPLAMIMVYTLIFSSIMQARLPGIESRFAYSIYLCAGVLAWGLFAEILMRCSNTFIENANLIKKISFPRICLPIIVSLSALINFSIIFSLFIGFLIITGSFPGWVFFAIFPVLLVQVLLSIGLGVTLGVLNVFFRDVGQLLGVVIQFWFWLTPIVYMKSMLPEQIQHLIKFNPMTSIISAYQGILLEGQLPSVSSLIPTTILALVTCLLGLRLYQRSAGEMVDEL